MLLSVVLLYDGIFIISIVSWLNLLHILVIYFNRFWRCPLFIVVSNRWIAVCRLNSETLVLGESLYFVLGVKLDYTWDLVDVSLTWNENLHRVPLQNWQTSQGKPVLRIVNYMIYMKTHFFILAQYFSFLSCTFSWNFWNCCRWKPS